MTDDTQRTLGHIEGTLQQILQEMKQQRTEFGEHLKADNTTNEILAKTISQLRDMMIASFKERDARLDALKQDNDRARGAGWVIIGIITFLGAAVIAALSGWIK